jgi:hypothetical protein
VALRLVRNLRDALGDAVPDGETVILTVTAPIRLPGRTATDLEGKIRTCLGSKSAEFKDMIHGNGIRARILKHGLAPQSKVVGFVHNPDSDPGILMDLTSALIDLIGAAAREPAPAGFSGERWLVLASEDRPSHIGTYRDVCAQLSLPAEFARILMVFDTGRVETLAEQKRDEDG